MKKILTITAIFTVIFDRILYSIIKYLTPAINGKSNISFSAITNQVITDIEKHPFNLGLNFYAWLFSFAIAIFISTFFFTVYGTKQYRGIEQGSARFGTFKDIKPYIDMDKKAKHYYDVDTNMIMTRTEGLTINTRKTLRNNNVLVVGGSGAGKTRFFVKPNLMQLHSSYVITDPKGEILRETGYMFEKNGYDIRVFNLIEPQYSAKYNPFRYIRDEKDILNIVNVIMKATKSGSSGVENGDFWDKAERALLMALFGYVHYELPPKDQSIATVMDMFAHMEAPQDNPYQPASESTVDKLFAQLPDGHFAKKQYHIFKVSSGRTASSILVTVGVRLAPWNMKPVRWLMNEDTLDLPSIGEKKVALFVIIPDSRQDFTFIAAMLYQQLFDMLYYEADYKYKGRLPVQVRFMLDEFPNIGNIPQFEKYLATMRSRDISASIIVQNLAQLKAMYKDQGQDAWETIVGNCDSFLFLGGQEQSTLKYISEKIGKTTIRVKNTTVNRGKQGGSSIATPVQGRELLSPDEIARLPNTHCLYLLRGVYPFKSRKFDIKLHKRYNELAEVHGKTFLPQEMESRRFKMFFKQHLLGGE